MSKYTTELRYICEVNAGLTESVGYNSIQDVLEEAAPKIFDFDYPIFDENYRLPLEIKILKHYYTREISEETVGLWKLRLDARMNEIMPLYNQMYESTLLKFNPLHDFSYSKTGTHNINKDDTGTITDTTDRASSGTRTGSNIVAHDSSDWDLYSDTPQGGTIGIGYASAQDPSLNANGYLTNARHVMTSGNESETSSETTSATDAVDSVSERDLNVTTFDQYTELISGKMGTKSYPEMLREFRENMINVDMMIIENLNDLFFGIWE